MLPTSSRLLKLLSLLQTRRVWTGPELAEVLEITERSVRRDVERLRDLGYPVHAAAGVGGGYQLGAGKEIPPLPFEEDEAVAVGVGLRIAATGVVSGLEEASVRALEKLERVLPKDLRWKVGALHGASVRLPDSGPRIDAEVLARAAEACREAKQLRFEYRDRSWEMTERNVEPYRLVHTSYRWYLLAFDLDRQAWRTFRVDRITGKPTPVRRFTPRPLPDDDVAAYVSRSVSIYVYRYRARVTVHASAEEVTRKLSSLGGQVVAIDSERCVVHAGGNELEWLGFLISHLGYEFEVHEPPELAEHLRQLAGRLARAADPKRREPEAPVPPPRRARD